MEPIREVPDSSVSGRRFCDGGAMCQSQDPKHFVEYQHTQKRFGVSILNVFFYIANLIFSPPLPPTSTLTSSQRIPVVLMANQMRKEKAKKKKRNLRSNKNGKRKRKRKRRNERRKKEKSARSKKRTRKER